MKITSGMKFVIVAEISREVEHGELYKGEELLNPRRNKWFAKIPGWESEQILCCFEGDFDHFFEAAKALEQK